MELRKWLWWPSDKTHALAGGAALIAVTILGLSGVPRFPAFQEFDKIQSSSGSFFEWSALLLIINVYLLYMNSRGDYFLRRLLPIGVSFLILAGIFPIAWGVHRMLVGSQNFSPCNLAAPTEDVALDINFLAKSMFVGEGGLFMVLTFSALWKPSQNTVEVRERWLRVQSLLRQVFRDEPPPQPTREETECLRRLLTALDEGAKSLTTRPLLSADLKAANKVSRFAKTVLDRMQTLSPVTDLRSSKDGELKAAVAFLLEEG